MKAAMATLRKTLVVAVECWELESHFFKDLILLSSTHGTYIWGRGLKTLLGRFLRRAYDVSRQSVFFNNIPYFVGRI